MHSVVRVVLLVCRRRWRRRLWARLPSRCQGIARRLRCGCGRRPLVASFLSCFCSVALRAAGCCLLCVVSAAPVCVAVAGCFGPCSCASCLFCCFALVGRSPVLKRAFWGFSMFFLLLNIFPLLRLFVPHAGLCATSFLAGTVLVLKR